MSRIILQSRVEDAIRDVIDDVIAFTPRLLGALLILLIGFIIGRIAGNLVERLIRVSTLDRRIGETRVGMFFPEGQEFSWAVGKVTSYYIYLLALLAAADVLGVAVLSEWLDRAVSWLPSLIAGLIIIFLGFLFADYLAAIIRQSPGSKRTGFASPIATAIQLFVYFLVLTIGLGTMGVDTTVLVVLVTAFVGALGLALALGLGLAIGLGGKEYVAQHVDKWAADVDDALPEPEESE